MTKKRHKKSIIGKFGIRDVSKAAHDHIKEYSTVHSLEMFNDLPYIGIFYFPTSDGKLYYCVEDNTVLFDGETFIRAKMITVDMHDFTYAYYDDHHGNICIREIRDGTINYIMEGNIIKYE